MVVDGVRRTRRHGRARNHDLLIPGWYRAGIVPVLDPSEHIGRVRERVLPVGQHENEIRPVGIQGLQQTAGKVVLEYKLLRGSRREYKDELLLEKDVPDAEGRRQFHLDRFPRDEIDDEEDVLPSEEQRQSAKVVSRVVPSSRCVAKILSISLWQFLTGRELEVV